MTSQAGQTSQERRTQVEIRGEDFWIDGEPTYRGRAWHDQRIEGLLFNARMVQATFDDLNPETRDRWAYPDTGRWDPERNVAEFIAQLPEYRRHGLLAVTVNLQGGSPEGYSKAQPWRTAPSARLVMCGPPIWSACGASSTGWTSWAWSRSSASSTRGRTSDSATRRP